MARQTGHARESGTCCFPRSTPCRIATGWISPGGLNYVSRRLAVPPAEAYGVATFYALFSVEQRPKTVVHVCDDVACRANGAAELAPRLSREHRARPTRRTRA